jgi:hypothetical protein
MPTANATSPRRTRRRAKSTRRAAAGTQARAAGASKVSARKTTSRKTTSRKTVKAGARKVSSTTASRRRAKAARTRALNQTRSAVHQAEIASRDTSGVFGAYAERAVLIPVGVALTARDRVVSSVSDTISTYSTSSKAQAQLRRFERRGATARNRFEREVRKARVKVEREVRQRRRELERTVGDLEDRRDAVAKNGSELAGRVPELTNLVPELANRVQERILTLV